jgi:hypothetical protein
MELNETIIAQLEDRKQRRIFIAATVLKAYAADSLGLSLVDAQEIVTPLAQMVAYSDMIDRADETGDFSELGQFR